MRRRLLICLVILFSSLWIGGGRLRSAGAGTGRTGAGGYRPGAVLARLQPGVSLPSSLRALSVAASAEELLPALDLVSLSVAPGQEAQVVEQLRRDPQVIFAELDYRAQALDARQPNDPDLGRQWSLPVIGALPAWQLISATQAITVAMLDSGMQLDHPDLAANLWTNPGEIPANGLDDDRDGKIDDVHGWHFGHVYQNGMYTPTEDARIGDDFGHGTHVAGVIGAVTDNGVGIAGLAQRARLLPVKVIDQYGNAWYSDIAAGIVYAAGRGARVINISAGGAPASQTLQAAVDYAAGLGVLVVASSGNDGGQVLYPAACASVVAGAATDAADQVTTYSSLGPALRLAAPGDKIYSAWYRGDYFVKSGTSMAAPHVSGVAALLLSARPSLTGKQLADILVLTGDVRPVGRNGLASVRRVNAANAARATLRPGPLRLYQLILPSLYRSARR